MIKRNFFALLILFIVLLIPYELISQVSPKHEMRALWVATVGNIDWPSKSDLSTVEQKKEMTDLLDLMEECNLNTVVLQIRPAADAYYSSAIEPWSQWLTGQQGKAPEPYYDPLEFTITECRKRGLEIHAWLNPYRAVTDTSNFVHPGHITQKHPDWFLTYGKTVYFNPGLADTRDYVSSVVSDIVRRYDIDAIHMDDYFYPYRIAGREFPDDSSFYKYPRGFVQEEKDDWRRDNVNLIIKQLSDSIRSVKPWVEFGISPFGVWRNISKDSTGSATKAGVTNYDDLYADILLWQKNGWIDYITPQIYWHIGFDLADYSTLAKWWSHNTFGCKLYIGQAPYRIARKSKTKEWRSSKEIIRQMELNRSFPNIGGSMFFSAKVFVNDPMHLNKKMTKKLYHYRALPTENNFVRIIPQRPDDAKMSVSGSMIHMSWTKKGDNKLFVIYKIKKGHPADIDDPRNILLVTSETEAELPLSRSTDTNTYNYYITSLSKTNTESQAQYFYLTSDN